mmetsp:Transcript_22940/g.58354  ORF Transcript_22940/g.58354 Transcript_22940/m.58354 type:complete len:216 (+) Transcript_22940:317-964(+)
MLRRHVLADLLGGGVRGREEDDAVLVVLRQERRDDRPRRAKDPRHVDDQNLLDHRREQPRARLLDRRHVLAEEAAHAPPERVVARRARYVVDHRPKTQLTMHANILFALQPTPLRDIHHVLREVSWRDGRWRVGGRIRRTSCAVAVAHLVAADDVTVSNILAIDDDVAARRCRARWLFERADAVDAHDALDGGCVGQVVEIEPTADDVILHLGDA